MLDQVKLGSVRFWVFEYVDNDTLDRVNETIRKL